MHLNDKSGMLCFENLLENLDLQVKGVSFYVPQ